MFDELKNENFKQISSLKEIIEKKDEKIISLENQVKQMKDSTDGKIGELTVKLKKINNLIFKRLCLVQIKNKWKEIVGRDFCCSNKCINTDKPIGNCIEGNGFVNIIDGENIKYINCVEEKAIGLIDCNDDSVELSLINGYICEIENNEICEEFKLTNFSFNENDVFGCGLVYPPTNEMFELPYIFFTQNGKRICKELFLNDNCNCYKPYIRLGCCSAETNFGNNLKENPFCFDFTKHFDSKHFFGDFYVKNENMESGPVPDIQVLGKLTLTSGLNNPQPAP
uniref:Uncharacterized protein n=1 Tax=Meloidogyne hapla TaxID=6305 RepID=A0A1I8C2X4_MELHA